MPKPNGPQPETTTASSNSILPSSTACTEHANGSIKAAFQGGIDLDIYLSLIKSLREELPYD